MNRKEFLEQLERLLYDIPPQERKQRWIITAVTLMKQEKKKSHR